MAPLVTLFGGSGFLGRHTVRVFARAGYRIRVACRYPNLANFLRPMGHVGQIQILKTNINDPGQVAAAIEGAATVVNLVGILYPGGHQNFEGVHQFAAGAIAKAARAAGVKTFIHVSAIGADEESSSAYARSKAAGERMVREAFPDAVVLRPSIMFGPEDGFFNKFASLARFIPALPLIGGGATKFQPVYVGDVAAAIVKCAGDPNTHGKTFELGGPTIYTFKELLQYILAETGRAGTRLLVPVPFPLAMLNAFFLGLLPKPILTMDQVRMLKTDNVVRNGVAGFAELGIAPDALEAVVPAYLWRFRRRGQYEQTPRTRINATEEIR